MYTRCLRPPAESFFLFGPRGTGKSTWLRQQLPAATWFDLLRLPLVLENGRVAIGPFRVPGVQLRPLF
jgi:hypothetical protein